MSNEYSKISQGHKYRLGGATFANLAMIKTLPATAVKAKGKFSHWELDLTGHSKTSYNKDGIANAVFKLTRNGVTFQEID